MVEGGGCSFARAFDSNRLGATAFENVAKSADIAVHCDDTKPLSAGHESNAITCAYTHGVPDSLGQGQLALAGQDGFVHGKIVSLRRM
jgi:hypothetical protein